MIMMYLLGYSFALGMGTGLAWRVYKICVKM